MNYAGGAVPIFERYKEWLEENNDRFGKEFLISKAIRYSLSNIAELGNYFLDGRLEIDNNRSERMMKSFVTEKKFSFVFSEDGADSSAIIYSIIETAFASGLKVEHYLKFIFESLPITKKNDYHKLLPYSNQILDILRIIK